MNKSEFSKLGRDAETALQEAVAEMIEDHKRRKLPYYIWKNGRVTEVCPWKTKKKEASKMKTKTETKNKIKHTPLPWQNGKNGGGHTGIFNKRSNAIAVLGYGQDEEFFEYPKAEANAAFIVRACNNHYKLLEALDQLLDRLNEHGSIDRIREEGPIEDARNAIEEARK